MFYFRIHSLFFFIIYNHFEVIYSVGLIHARETLKNRHIIMIGDSLMRFQYLSLVYFLRHNRGIDNNMDPNMINEKGWGSWQDYFRGTSSLLAPYEYCDCFRKNYENCPWMENRYYIDNTHKLFVTYLWL